MAEEDTASPFLSSRSIGRAGYESWFQKNSFRGNPNIVARWANLHNALAQAWVKADRTHGAYVDDSAKTHPALVAKWIKENPGPGAQSTRSGR
jgi:hypothetical protein